MQKSIINTAVRLAMLAAPVAIAGFSTVAVAQEETARVERIEVTGSRIKRIGELAPTPITVITGDSLVSAGVVNVGDLLHKMPNTLVGLSPETSNNTVFASGLNNTDLRGLGSSRTLVLVNGRRFVSGAPGSSAVDLNNIPTAVVERVEITTGGASAVYGSDAIAGVVNIITKKSYDGITLDVSTTQPTQSGGEEEYASITFGSESGRASFITNLSWARQKQISYMDRDYLRDAPIVIRNPRVGAVDFDARNEPNAVFEGLLGRQVLAAYDKTGTFVVGGKRYNFTDSGELKEMALGQPLPPNPNGRVDYLGGEGYVFAENQFLRTPLDRINLFSSMKYDINDNHAFTAEFTYSKTDAYGESSPAFLSFGVLGDNALLPQAARDLIRSTANSNFPDGRVSMGYLASDFGNRRYSQDRTLARIALGLEGFVGDYSYDVYATSGHVQADTEWYGEMFEQRFYDAVDAIELDGQIVCRSAAARANGCLPLDIFGRGIYNQDAYNWVSTDALRRSSIQQHVVGASVSGELFEVPAGGVAGALTAEYRKEKADTLPDPAMRDGLLFNNQSAPLAGDFDVKEMAAELSVPLLADLPFADMLTLETAFRWMDYSTSGTDNAWKIGLNWAVNDELRVRVNRSKSVRAPNIGELYNPPGQTFRSITDWCASSRANALPEKYADNIRANCAAQGIPTTFEPSAEWFSSTRPGFIVGNTELKNEVAKDITVGFVYTPAFIDNFSLTVDYWKFDISDMINSFTGTSLVTLCYQADSLDNPYCPLIERDPQTFEIVNYFEKPVNSAVSRTSGFDIEANYRLATAVGDFGFRLISTYLQERMYNSTGRPDDQVINTGEVLRPKWKHRWTTDYTYADFSAALTMTHRSATVLSNTWSPNVNNYNDVPSYTTFDLTARYNVSPKLQLRTGMLNMFDRNPPRQPGVYDDGAAFEVIGRRITAGLKYDF